MLLKYSLVMSSGPFSRDFMQMEINLVNNHLHVYSIHKVPGF